MYMMSGTGEEFTELFSDETNNLLMNMVSGLLPEHLVDNEIKLLIQRFGENWSSELGYSEPEFKNPKFEQNDYFTQ